MLMFVGGCLTEYQTKTKVENQLEDDYGITSSSLDHISSYVDDASFSITSTTKTSIIESSSFISDADDSDFSKTIQTTAGTTTTPSQLPFIKPMTVQSVQEERMIATLSPRVQTVEKQQNIVRPIIQKSSSMTTFHQPLLPKPEILPSFHSVHSYQPLNKLAPKSQQHHYSLSPVHNKPQDFSYMVSTSQNGNQITIIPDDFSKHSNKERLRRYEFLYSRRPVTKWLLCLV